MLLKILLLTIAAFFVTNCSHKFIMKNCQPSIKKESIEYLQNGFVKGELTGEENCQQRSIFDK